MCSLGWVGRMEGEYHIELDDKVEPVVHPSRRVPKSLLERLKLKLQGRGERYYPESGYTHSMG